jgi:hypothetical protein
MTVGTNMLGVVSRAITQHAPVQQQQQGCASNPQAHLQFSGTACQQFSTLPRDAICSIHPKDRAHQRGCGKGQDNQHCTDTRTSIPGKPACTTWKNKGCISDVGIRCGNHQSTNLFRADHCLSGALPACPQFTMPLWLKLLTLNYDLTGLNISVRQQCCVSSGCLHVLQHMWWLTQTRHAYPGIRWLLARHSQHTASTESH